MNGGVTEEMARREAELLRRALLEAGVREDQFNIVVDPPGGCVVLGCQDWHAFSSWDPDLDKQILWKAFQLCAIEMGMQQCCYTCWLHQIEQPADGCQTTQPLMLDCGMAR